MFVNDIFKKKQLNEGGFDIPEIPRAPRPNPTPTKEKTVDEAGPFSYGAKKPRKGSVADLAAKKRQEQEKGKQPAEPKDHMVGVARVVKEFAPSGGGGGRWYSDDQLYDIIGEDWLEAFDVSGDRGNIDLNGERARLFLAQEAEAWLTDRGYRVNVLDVRDDGDSLSWYIQGPLYKGVAEGSAQEKLYKRHQELRRKSGLPDPDYYKELKATYDLPDAERHAKAAELKKKYQVKEARKAEVNFDVEDLKRLEQIRDLPTLKAQAMALISKPSERPMKPEKVAWFDAALDRMDNRIQIIKLMYDLLLSGEGYSVIGSRRSMNPNTYRQRFGEQQVTNEDVEKYLEAIQRAGYDVLDERKMTCPECGGAAYADQILAEKKDACYSKVKSRYKVWPSAYASGALVRCRKVGAKNWGNKSKK
jgi:hypothetical protein